MEIMSNSSRLSKGDLIVMTPIVQGSAENLIRVQRYRHDEHIPENILHIAGGEHTGILVRRYTPGDEENTEHAHLQLDFTVFLVGASTGDHKQENRQFRFWFYEYVENGDRHRLATDFFRIILSSFPKDYVGFLKRVMKMMQQGFVDLRRVEVDMRLIDDAAPLPESKEYAESGSEVESVTVGHVQEALENYFPNGLSIESIASALRCTREDIYNFLNELQEMGVAQELEGTGEWILVEQAVTSVDHDVNAVKEVPRPVQTEQPTVAIVTALFVEKLAVDSMIEGKNTVHRYKSDGQSNVYTIGNIGSHRVVATKLSAVGHTRAAMTAAGSITTRLLGNFQQVEHVLIVGVGGGVPHYTDKERHVRLGDVVVSGPINDTKHSYVFCDKLELDRETGNVIGFKVNKWVQNDMIIPRICQQLMSETNKEMNGYSNGDCVDSDDQSTPWCELAADVEDSLNTVTKSSSEYTFSRPPEDTDNLMFPIGEGNMILVPHPNKERTWPRLHLGPVGAGRPVLREPSLRDEFSERYQVRAFDADFDSVVEAIQGSRLDSWAVIRGIADYGDGMRNKQWQAYAALQAAAFAKLLVSRLPSPV